MEISNIGANPNPFIKNGSAKKEVTLKDVLHHNIAIKSKLMPVKEIKKIFLHEHYSNFEFALATLPYEIVEIFKLRFLSYGEEGYIDKSYFNQGIEYDEFDLNSAMFLVRNMETGKLHACARIVLDVDCSLPMEQFVSLKDFRSSETRIAEFSRLISYPKGQKPINRALVDFIYRFARSINLTHLLGFGKWSKKEYYESIGLKILEPLRKIYESNMGSGHLTSDEFYVNVIDLRETQWDNNSQTLYVHN